MYGVPKVPHLTPRTQHRVGLIHTHMLAALTASLAVAHPARPPLRAQLRLAAAPPPAGFEWGAFDRAGLLEKLDTQVVSRAVRLANHVPASASLAYFGLISTTMMSTCRCR